MVSPPASYDSKATQTQSPTLPPIQRWDRVVEPLSGMRSLRRCVPGCNVDVAQFEGIWVWRGLAAEFWRKEVVKKPDPYEMDREMTGPVLIHISASVVL